MVTYRTEAKGEGEDRTRGVEGKEGGRGRGGKDGGWRIRQEEEVQAQNSLKGRIRGAFVTLFSHSFRHHYSDTDPGNRGEQERPGEMKTALELEG